MATTENSYTGDGSTVLYSFTFPYLATADIKVSLDGVDTTAYSLANATTVEMVAAPANGVVVRIYRVTPLDSIDATFFPGSAIRSQDLNDNFTQLLYVTQETEGRSIQADGDYDISGIWNFTTVPTSDDPTATNHLATKNYVDTIVNSGVVDGNKGDLTVTGGGLTWTLNSTYLEPSDIGVSVQAYDATILNAADIGVSVQAYDATYLKSADIGVSVQAYDATYLKSADIGVSVQAYDATYLKSADIGSTVQGYDADTVKQDVIPTFTVATRSTERTITGGAFDLATGNLWTCGAITVPNPTNAVAGQTGAIRITAGPVVWSSNFKFPGGTAPTIASYPAVIPYYVSGSSTILMGNAVAGIA